MNPRKKYVIGLLAAFCLTGCAQLIMDIKQRIGLTPTPNDSWGMMLSNDPDVVREGILGIIERRDSDPEIVGKFAERLTFLLKNDESQLVRSATAIALETLGEKTLTLPALLHALDDESNRPVVLVDAIHAAAALGVGEPGVRRAILQTFETSSDESVRRAAVVALGRVGGDNDLPLLLNALEDDSSQVKYGAAQSLRLLTGMPFKADLDLWLEWYDSEKRAEVLAAWQARQDRLAAEREGRKGGLLHGTLSTLGKVGAGVADEFGLAVHELVLTYKRTKRSLFGHGGRKPPDRSDLPTIEPVAAEKPPPPEEAKENPDGEPKREQTVQENGPPLWKYPILGVAWLAEKVVTVPLETVKWVGDRIVFWDDD